MAAVEAPLIAVIDSDPALKRLLGMILTMDGFRTLFLKGREGSVEAIEEEKPHLVVLDTWLDDRESGWELLEDLRKNEKTAGTPLVICSSDPEEMKQRQVFVEANGLVSVLNKPFDPDLLVERIRSMLAAAD